VKAEFWRAFKAESEVHESLEAVTNAMGTATPEALDKLLTKMDKYQRMFEAMDGYGLETRIDKLMPEMGFSAEDGERLVNTFSGGWQMRMNLGKILLQSPDLLLLDEPTNHLDLETIEWLENYLKELNTPMVIVSHDREFLDRLCTQIVETERGVSSTYLGNYSRYLEQKAEGKATQQSTFDRQQKDIAKQQEFVERFRASANRGTQAKSREKMLDKLDRIEAPINDVRGLRFRFPEPPRSGRVLAEIENMTHEYDQKILFLGVDLIIERGDKIAIVGPNGAGKSTLLRLMMGMEQPSEGKISLGDHNVIPSYFEQNQAEALDLVKTVMMTIHDEMPDWTNEEVRTLLGQFLFSGETAFKPVGALSGGEKARLALAKMLLKPANLLVLDEPTNHLDIPAKEMLEDAIRNYEGSVMIVSHDRYFVSRTATKIVEIRDGELRVYRGDFNYYLDKIAEEKDRGNLEAIEAAEAAKVEAKRQKSKDKEQARKKQKVS
jgi:ATP-binding cassette, subfamily F, member 3